MDGKGLNLKNYSFYLLYSLIFFLLFIIICLKNDGYFVFTLDDPYIHLALAENIAKGHYGVNLNELSAPSSSIIWPFLLALFSSNPAFEFIPLILNLLCGLGSVWVFSQLFNLCFKNKIPHFNTYSFAFLIIFTIASYQFGLIFSGMEHSLQLLIAMLLLYGNILYLEKNSWPKWLPWMIVFAPLVRYELFVLSFFTLVIMLKDKQYRSALTSLGILILIMGSFSLLLLFNGLGILPTSVIDHSSLLKFLLELSEKIQRISIEGFTLFKFGFALFFILLLPLLFTKKNYRLLIIALLATVIAQLAALKFVGEYHILRYTSYLNGLLFTATVYFYKDLLISLFNKGSLIPTVMIACGLGFIIFNPTLIAGSAQIPLASGNIYQQQYQMHRFVESFYQQPVAVNDLGLVVYKNPHYVLDLIGLGNYEAFKLRKAREKNWMGRLAKKHNIHLAMIYHHWFSGQVPSDWTELGVLKLNQHRLSSASNWVYFYSTDPAYTEEIINSVKAFQTTLPQDAELKLLLGT